MRLVVKRGIIQKVAKIIQGSGITLFVHSSSWCSRGHHEERKLHREGITKTRGWGAVRAPQRPGLESLPGSSTGLSFHLRSRRRDGRGGRHLGPGRRSSARHNIYLLREESKHMLEHFQRMCIQISDGSENWQSVLFSCHESSLY